MRRGGRIVRRVGVADRLHHLVDQRGRRDRAVVLEGDGHLAGRRRVETGDHVTAGRNIAARDGEVAAGHDRIGVGRIGAAVAHDDQTGPGKIAVPAVQGPQFDIRDSHITVQNDRGAAFSKAWRAVQPGEGRRIVHGSHIDLNRSGRDIPAALPVIHRDSDGRRTVAADIGRRRVADVGSRIEIGVDVRRRADQRDRRRVDQGLRDPAANARAVCRGCEGPGRGGQGDRDRIAVDIGEACGRQIDIAQRVFGHGHAGRDGPGRIVVHRRDVHIDRTQRDIARPVPVIGSDGDCRRRHAVHIGRRRVTDVRNRIQIGIDIGRRAHQRDRRRVDQGFGHTAADTGPVRRGREGSRRRGQRHGDRRAVDIRETGGGQIDIAQRILGHGHAGRKRPGRIVVHRRDVHIDRTQRDVARPVAVIGGDGDRRRCRAVHIGRRRVADVRHRIQIGVDIGRRAHQRDRRRIDQGFGHTAADTGPVRRGREGPRRRGQRHGDRRAVDIRETGGGQVNIAQRVLGHGHAGRERPCGIVVHRRHVDRHGIGGSVHGPVVRRNRQGRGGGAVQRGRVADLGRIVQIGIQIGGRALQRHRPGAGIRDGHAGRRAVPVD